MGVRVRISGPILGMLVFACLSAMPVFALPPSGVDQPTATKSFDYGTYADTNDILMFVNNRGWIGHDPNGLLGRRSGLYYPRGTNRTMIYSSGLWVVSRMGKAYRASVAEYDADFSPGPMKDGSYLPDNEKFRVYKIARGDSPESNPDFAEWPFDQGAPALKNQAGADSLDELGRRIPRIMADQTMWTVFNDANPANHSSDPGGLASLGIEVQLLSWSEQWPGALGRTVFFHYTLINKGDSTLRDARVGLWADPDIGSSTNDLVGCDTALSLGYCYNDGPDPVYGEHPPAVGFAILAGPAMAFPGDSVWSVHGDRYRYGLRAQRMTAFSAWGNGGDPVSEPGVYYILKGEDREGFPAVDPVTRLQTPFQYAGDPVDQIGWVNTDAQDWRFAMATGPVTIARNDTIEIVAAALVGEGGENVHPVQSLKDAAEIAQCLYRGKFESAYAAAVDVLPGSCPNVVSFDDPIDLDFDFVRPAAAVPTSNIVVAMYSTREFDATSAIAREVSLGGVRPANWTVEDVGRADSRETPCDCGTASRDGLVDLLLIFDRDKVADALQPLVEGAVRTLELRTIGREGARGRGQDCLTFVDLARAYDPLPFGPSHLDNNAPFSLSNQPNPFNAATMITYRIATDGPVRVEVYDILGRRTATLVDAWQRVGEYQVMWNGIDIHGDQAGSGMYFYRLQSDDGILTKKMILLK